MGERAASEWYCLRSDCRFVNLNKHERSVEAACSGSDVLIMSKTNSDTRILDSPEAAKPLFLVPFSRDATFVDRVKIFEDIDEKSKTYHRISLSGIGGVG